MDCSHFFHKSRSHTRRRPPTSPTSSDVASHVFQLGLCGAKDPAPRFFNWLAAVEQPASARSPACVSWDWQHAADLIWRGHLWDQEGHAPRDLLDGLCALPRLCFSGHLHVAEEKESLMRWRRCFLSWSPSSGGQTNGWRTPDRSCSPCNRRRFSTLYRDDSSKETQES